ncbi:acetate--CoA ligase family protein [Roseovarius atlanticus]|uniref:acetate--CoA ligase family protein n=1 Tax=Roseovarius atlanticus TaxID=1641875 RepID=UPI00118748B8|nr:acetate--CoA ligase [Roseovarius atlanticus]
MSITQLFSPTSVAIVGVSGKDTTFQVGGRAVLEHLVKHGFRGRIDMVTRSPITLHGITSVTSLADLPTAPECVVLSIPAAQVPDTVQQALDMGIRAFVTISAGFSEAGAEGAALQERLVGMLRDHGAVMLGPNTTGLINFGRDTALSSTSRLATHSAPRGDIGVVVQSGALGSLLMDVAERDQIGMSYLISTGNEAVTDIADCVDFLIDDPETRSIALYVEAFRHPKRIVAAARRAFASGKPIAIYKAGRSDTGAAAAAGHTGALLGARSTYEAAARQLGLTDVKNIEDLLPVAHYLAHAGGGRSVGVLTVSGGLGGCLADALAHAGDVDLPNPGAAVSQQLQQYLPDFLKPKNPVDVGGSPFREQGGFSQCLGSFASDPAFEAVAVANTPVVPTWAQDSVDAISRVEAETGKPIVALWPSDIYNAEALRDLRVAGKTVFTRIDTAVAALNGKAAYLKCQDRPSSILDAGPLPLSYPQLGQSGLHSLDEASSKKRLQDLGIPFTKETFVIASNRDTALAQARVVGYPVTVKGIAEGVVHKSEYGLVAVGVADEPALTAVLDEMQRSAGAHRLDLRGFILAETLRAEAEVFVSVSYDREFGPSLTLGSGGIYTEVFKDVTTRLLPLARGEITNMIDDCKIGKILRGARGKAALDIEALTGLIEKLADLGGKLSADFAGLEINPVGVGAAGQGAWIFDATVFSAGGKDV